MAMPLDDAPTPLVLAKLGGTVLGGRYGLGRILGAGGMGAVFEAKDLRLERAVAIKVLRPAFAGRADYIERFLREAQAASKIRHRNVVVILDYGETASGLVYSVMELCVGQDLELLLRGQVGQRLPWVQACGLLVQIASGLRAAHAQGVIHRDIKPANCFVTEEDDEPVVKIVDFGIAKFDDGAQTQQITRQQLTGASDVLGTPCYIAPEIVRTARSAGPRSDVYSLGVLAYRILTGCLPFTGETAFEVMRRACMDPVPSLREQVAGLPAGVERLVLEMMAKTPEERPVDMLAVRERLQVIGRETLGVPMMESGMSKPSSRGTSAIRARLPAPAPRTPGLGELCRGALSPGPPPVESTAVLLSPLPAGAGRGPSRPPGAPPAVIVAPARMLWQPIHDPTSLPSRSTETLPGLASATLPMADSASIARPRRRMMGWLAGVSAIVVLGVAVSASLDEEVGSSSEVGSEVEVAEPGGTGVAAKQRQTIEVEDGKGAEVVEQAEPVAVAVETDEELVIDEPAAIDEPQAPTKQVKQPLPSQQAATPSSDVVIQKRLERKIRAKCAAELGYARASVSFFVTKNGGISLLTATPSNAAGQCAKRQVEGTKFRPRASGDTPIKILVE